MSGHGVYSLSPFDALAPFLQWAVRSVRAVLSWAVYPLSCVRPAMATTAYGSLQDGPEGQTQYSRAHANIVHLRDSWDGDALYMYTLIPSKDGNV